MRCQNLEGFIKIALFFAPFLKAGDKKPSIEIFINPEGCEHITRYWDEDGSERWTSTMIKNLNVITIPDHNGKLISQSSYTYSCHNQCWINPEGKKTLYNRLGSPAGYRPNHAIECIMQFQEKCNERKRQQAEDRECAKWDDQLKIVPPEPKGLNSWIRRHVAEAYIFYRTGEQTGRCSACGSDVPIKNKIKHNAETVCPHCKREAVYKNINIMSKCLTSVHQPIQVIQQSGDSLILRAYDCWNRYINRNIDNPVILSREYARKIYQAGQAISRWTYGDYKNKTKRWLPARYNAIFGGPIYPQTRITLLRSGLPMLIKNHVSVCIDDYLELESQYSVIESLTKIGLHKLVKWITNGSYRYKYGSAIDLTKTSAVEALKIDKARLKRLVAMNGGIVALTWLQYEKNADTWYPDKIIKEFDEAEIDYRKLVYIEKFYGYKQHSVVPIHNYLKKQQVICGETLKETFQTYSDYLSMAEQNKCRMDLEQIIKPKDLKAAHDFQVKLSKQEEIAKQAKEINKRFKKLEKNIKDLAKYEYSDGTYQIVAPRSTEDIIVEGLTLEHCIHRCDFYFERICTKESFILFLRKTEHPDSPWYTLEVEPGGNIRQKRTTGDRQNDDLKKALPFLKKWQKKVVASMDAKEKKLALISDQKRQENYADIRKQNKKVWHGIHQGELLADVLEADFVAAM